MNKLLTGWDVTIPKQKFEKDDLFKILGEWCKKWAAQVELGAEKNYLHWQIRLRLIKKKRRAEAIEQTGLDGHWSPTSGGVHSKANFNYVMKADTRVEGPWTDKDYEPPKPVTLQIQKFLEKERYPCWIELEQKIQKWEERKIICISDRGMTGKSIFLEYMEYLGLARRCPPRQNAQDLLRCVYGMPDSRCYMIDMPRAMKKDNLSQFYTGVETIKDGWCYDDRYNWKSRYILPGRPNVVVFGNSEPDRTLLTEDMWDVYTINEKYELEPVTEEWEGASPWRPASGL